MVPNEFTDVFMPCLKEGCPCYFANLTDPSKWCIRSDSVVLPLNADATKMMMDIVAKGLKNDIERLQTQSYTMSLASAMAGGLADD